eukprot:465236-Ditylum_brightwellii.AAC.1
MYNEYKQLMTPDTFLTDNSKVELVLGYETSQSRHETVALLIHVQGLMLLAQFKIIVLRIGELTQVDPAKVHRIQYQEYINGILDDIAKGKNAKDLAYFQSYGTMIDMVKYKLQILKFKPTIEVKNSTVATKMLAAYALKSHTRMAQEMMEWVGPSSNEYHNIVKFVPVSLATNKAIEN